MKIEEPQVTATTKDLQTALSPDACSSLLCMIMAIYSGHKMISGKSRKKKDSTSEESAE